MRSVSPTPPPSQSSGTAPSQSVPAGTVAPVPAATGGTAPSPAATQPVQVPIVKAPDLLSTLPTGTVLSGTVVNAEQSGLLKILTRYGSFALDSKLALPNGTKVALQVRGGGQVHLQIVDPETPARLPEGAAKTLAEASIRLPNQILTATLESTLAPQQSGQRGPGLAGAAATPPLAAASGQGTPGNANPAVPVALRQLTAGSQFQVQLTAINTGPTTTDPNAAARAAPAAIAATASASATALPAAASTATNNPILSGTVIASAAQGRPVLQTAFGILSLDNRVQLPLGTNVRIQVLANSLPQATAGPAAAASLLAQPLAGAASGWTNLDAMVRQGEASAVPGALAAKIMQRVPTAGSALGSNMLFLLSALNTGHLNSWLGRATVDQMQREGQNSLSGRLDQDLAQAGRISDASGGEWRTLILPFLDDGQIRQLRLFVRSGQDDGEGDDQEQSTADATRFLLELEFSKLGDLQLDGLIRSKLFDLILRTRKPFSPAMHDEIIRIFTESNHNLGMAGQILFEASDDWRSKATESAPLTDTPDLMI